MEYQNRILIEQVNIQRLFYEGKISLDQERQRREEVALQPTFRCKVTIRNGQNIALRFTNIGEDAQTVKTYSLENNVQKLHEERPVVKKDEAFAVELFLEHPVSNMMTFEEAYPYLIYLTFKSKAGTKYRQDIVFEGGYFTPTPIVRLDGQ